jgi:hypothetical protein
LIRRSLYQQLGPARRKLLHGRAADLALGDDAVVGRHAWLAGRPDDVSRHLTAAGDLALARLAPIEAEALFEEALAAAREARIGQGDQARIPDRIGRARSARSDYSAAAEAHLAALELSNDAAMAAL